MALTPKLSRLALAVVASALVVVGTVGVSSASATLPAFYHCVKQTGGKWEAGCGTEKVGGGWEKVEVASGSSIAFSASRSTGIERLEDEGLFSIVCTGNSITGHITGAKTVKANIVLTGCEVPEFHSECQTETGSSGELKWAEVQGELGYLKSTGKITGLSVKPVSGELLATFFCAGFSISQLKGGVIGELAILNKIVTSGSLLYRQISGKQVWKKLEGGPENILQMEINGGNFLKAALEAEDSTSYSEGIEIRA